MSRRIWMAATVTSFAVSAVAIAQPQPGGDQPAGDGSAQTGSGSAQAGSGSADTRPTTFVTSVTSLFVDRNPQSGVAFVARPGDVLYPSGKQGLWTLVENAKGEAGWIETSLLGVVPRDPDDVVSGPAEKPAPPAKPRPPDPHVDMPEVLTIPTGWLLPAAVVYSRTSIDTGGGVATDGRVGLGDVAEFGVATTDNVRIKDKPNDDPTQIQPYVTASFRMGVAENRLFENQPGIVLGFRKSFQRTIDSYKTRIAELTLVASKKLGSRAAIHVGGAFWDAEISGKHSDGTALDESLHGYNTASRQIRAFGGFEARPFDRSEILIDLSWAPVFCKDCADFDPTSKTGGGIALRPQLAWGVRYEVTDYMRLESGVRVPDIGDFNLLNAQIFGQVTFTSWAIRHAVDDLK